MTNPAEKFTQFYEAWVSKLEKILKSLFQEVTKQGNGEVTSDQELQNLVSIVTSHMQEYYNVKWDIAKEDVFIFFSPVWLNPHENLNQWMTGFKPSSVFTLLDTLKKNKNEFGIHMTEEQHVKIEELRKKIKMEEWKLEMETERRQVGIADRKTVGVAKLSSRAMNGASQMEQVAMNGASQMEQVVVNDVFARSIKIMRSSDSVRRETIRGVLDVLNPKQSVLFLATHVATHLGLRQCGRINPGNQNVEESIQESVNENK